MNSLHIAIVVFLAVFFTLTALLLLLTRAPDKIERRLRNIRDGVSARMHGDLDNYNAESDAAKLFDSDPASPSDLRTRLVHAGFRGRHNVLWYNVTRITLAVALGALGYEAQRVLQLQHLLSILTILGGVGLGFAGPAFFVNERVTRRREAIRRAIPNVLDLIIVCVEAGLSLNAAIQRIAAEMKTTYPELAEELNILNQEIFIGKSRGETFRNLARRTGVDELRSLATVLMQSDRMGTSIADVLRVQAETLRVKRRQRALETAHKMPVKLVFPLVLFIFPEIMVVLLGPAGIQFFRSLSEIVK